jgi:hypothetical protein
MGSGRVSTSKLAVTLWSFSSHLSKGPQVRPLPPEPTPPQAAPRHRRSAQGKRWRARRTTPGRRGSIRAPGAGLFSFHRSRRLIARGCRPWPFNGRRLLALDGTANAEILGQFVPSLATRPEIQVQRNARVIRLSQRDLLPGLGRAAIGDQRAVSAIPEPWATRKAAERWLEKEPLDAHRDIIRVWGLLHEYHPPTRRAGPRRWWGHRADARAALVGVLGVPAEDIRARDRPEQTIP